MSKRPLKIIKIGGDIVENTMLFKDFLTQVARIKDPFIIIHGGGNKASQLQERLEIPAVKIDGRRVTDSATLDVVTMVYAGLINKKIVAALQALGKNAVGLSGADGDAIRAHKRIIDNINYGFAGDIDKVNITFIQSLLENHQVPVFCPITHDGNGQLLNTNADTLASKIASALSAQYAIQLYYCFTKNGVLETPSDDHSVIEVIDEQAFESLKTRAIITDGMLPKMDTAFEALLCGVDEVHLGMPKIIMNPHIKHTQLCL